MHCYDIWAGADITGSTTAQTGYSITKLSEQQQRHIMVYDRVLSLVLLGRVEVFLIIYPLKPRVVEELC
jgi:hypothetical protein